MNKNVNNIKCLKAIKKKAMEMFRNKKKTL